MQSFTYTALLGMSLRFSLEINPAITVFSQLFQVVTISLKLTNKGSRYPK